MTAIVVYARRLTQYLLLVLTGILVASCSILSPAPVKPLQPPPKAISPTPTDFISSTPIGESKIWLSPSVPSSFRESLISLDLPSPSVEWVEEREAASIALMPGSGNPIATWIYALVAPFPTTDDGRSWDELQSLWSGSDRVNSILVSASTLEMLEILFEPAGENVLVVTEQAMLDLAWQIRPSLAIIPFEALEPRWKVLELDGQSPLRKDFDVNAYPLKGHIGIEGPVGVVDAFAELIDIPSTNRDPDRLTVLVMTGVTALTRATAWQMDRRGVDFPAEKIGAWLTEADLTHISNEVAFARDCPLPDPQQEGLKFCSNPDYIELLELIGTDIIELTGNHVRDYGVDALEETLEKYRQRGWGTFGGGANLEAANEPYMIEHNGNRLAFLGCNYAGPKYAWATEDLPGSTPCDLELLFDRMEALVEEEYLVVFTFQWTERGALAEDQRQAFESAIEAGAAIVSGSQAHQPLGFDFYQGGFIHFGLGNLFFDQMQTRALRSEIIDRHVFYEGRHISTELLTAFLESYAQPRPMTDQERTELLSDVFDQSGW